MSARAEESPASWRLSTGVNYSRGDYANAIETEVVSVPVSLKLTNGGFSIRASVPWLHVSGPGAVIEGIGGSGVSIGGGAGGSGATTGGVQGDVADRGVSGLGDLGVALGYTIDLGGDAYVDVTARVKLPTASRRKGLGTGETDVTLGAELAKYFGAVGIYGGARRKFAGDSATFPVRNTWSATGGISLDASDTVTLGVDYDWLQSSFRGRQSINEVTAWSNVRLSDRVRLNIYGTTGLNANSVDFAGGLSVSYRFGR